MCDSHPNHYSQFDIEPIDAIEDWGLGFHLGNVVKYVVRAGHKDGEDAAKDLRKAAWYIKRVHDSMFTDKDPKDAVQCPSE